MDAFLAAKVWHYWMSYAIFGAVFLAVVATFVGYLIKVTGNKYHRQ